MARMLLVIGAGVEAIPGLQRARHLRDLDILAVDGNPHAPGFAYADDHLIVSTYDGLGMIDVVGRYARSIRTIDGVIALAADVPMTVARVAQSLHLPGISRDTARLTSDKLAQIQHLDAAGIPVPWYSDVTSCEQLQRLVETSAYLLVLKPVDSRGARGVLRLLPDVDLAWAYAHSLSCSPSGRVMVEAWLDGPQISTETVLHDGWAMTPGFIDRNYALLDRYAPYVLEDGGQQPSALSQAAIDEVSRLAERAARALGITEGIAKGDMVLTREGPAVIEMASRLSGGYMSSIQVPLGTGVDLVGIAIRLALGEPVTQEECAVHQRDGVAIRYLWPQPGCVHTIHGSELLVSTPGFHMFQLFIKPGDLVEIPTDHTQRAGCVISTGQTRDEAVRRAEGAVRVVSIEMESY